MSPRHAVTNVRLVAGFRASGEIAHRVVIACRGTTAVRAIRRQRAVRPRPDRSRRRRRCPTRVQPSPVPSQCSLYPAQPSPPRSRSPRSGLRRLPRSLRGLTRGLPLGLLCLTRGLSLSLRGLTLSLGGVRRIDCRFVLRRLRRPGRRAVERIGRRPRRRHRHPGRRPRSFPSSLTVVVPAMRALKGDTSSGVRGRDHRRTAAEDVLDALTDRLGRGPPRPATSWWSD